MKKRFNFRPLCWLAMGLMIEIAASMTSLWLGLLVLLGALLMMWLLKLPRALQMVAMLVLAGGMFSFVLTKQFNPNPIYRSYNPDAGLRGAVLHYAHWYLELFLSKDHAALLFSMMFGNKNGLPIEIKSNFQGVGMAHLLVVSGLHVMLMAQVIGWLLKKCRVPKRRRVYVIAPILIFYAYLCGWQYAILRAVIMSLVYAVAENSFYPADRLSTLAFSAIVILLVFPYALVSASFWLSFACLFGIHLFYQPIVRRFPVPAVAMYLAVTIGSLPIVLYYFGRLPILGVVANVVIVPLLVAAFYLGMLAVCTFFLGAVLFLAEPLLDLAVWGSDVLAAVPFDLTVGAYSWAAIIIYYLGALLISQYVFMRPRWKYVLAAAVFTCYFLIIML